MIIYEYKVSVVSVHTCAYTCTQARHKERTHGRIVWLNDSANDGFSRAPKHRNSQNIYSCEVKTHARARLTRTSSVGDHRSHVYNTHSILRYITGKRILTDFPNPSLYTWHLLRYKHYLFFFFVQQDAIERILFTGFKSVYFFSRARFYFVIHYAYIVYIL